MQLQIKTLSPRKRTNSVRLRTIKTHINWALLSQIKNKPFSPVKYAQLNVKYGIFDAYFKLVKSNFLSVFYSN